jgi:hypothetical protein
VAAHLDDTLFESPDSLSEAVNSPPSRQYAITYSNKLESAVWKVVDTIGDLVLALFGFDEQDWFDFTNEGLTEDEEYEMRELGIEGIGGGGGGGGGLTGSGSGLSSWSESTLYVEVSFSLVLLTVTVNLNLVHVLSAYTIFTPFETLSFRTSSTRETFERLHLSDFSLHFFFLRLFPFHYPIRI